MLFITLKDEIIFNHSYAKHSCWVSQPKGIPTAGEVCLCCTRVECKVNDSGKHLVRWTSILDGSRRPDTARPSRRLCAASSEPVAAKGIVDQLVGEVLSALAPGGGYQSSWGTLLLVLGGMNRDAVPGMSINGHQASV